MSNMRIFNFCVDELIRRAVTFEIDHLVLLSVVCIGSVFFTSQHSAWERTLSLSLSLGIDMTEKDTAQDLKGTVLFHRLNKFF